jgi:hypothetical protein
MQEHDVRARADRRVGAHYQVLGAPAAIMVSAQQAGGLTVYLCIASSPRERPLMPLRARDLLGSRSGPAAPIGLHQLDAGQLDQTREVENPTTPKRSVEVDLAEEGQGSDETGPFQGLTGLLIEKSQLWREWGAHRIWL